MDNPVLVSFIMIIVMWILATLAERFGDWIARRNDEKKGK